MEPLCFWLSVGEREEKATTREGKEKSKEEKYGGQGVASKEGKGKGAGRVLIVHIDVRITRRT